MTATVTTGATDSDTLALAGVMPARTIKPRTRGFTFMRLAVATPDGIVDEDGELHSDIPAYVKRAEPTAFITIDPSAFLGELDDCYNLHPHWRFTLARIVADKGTMSMSRVKLTTFGFRACKTPAERADCPLCCGGLSSRKQRLHQCWDPRSMSPTPVHKMIGDASITSLLQWGIDVRTWAQEQDLELRVALSGYGSQLLRDPRFYPEPRRRVPRATNERVRPALPGNLVRLVSVEPGPLSRNVTSIDQRSAHHRIAQSIALPDANTLFARGYFNDPENGKIWARRGTRLYERTINQPGLVYVIATSRLTAPNEFRLLAQNFTGQRGIYLWTNTVPFLESTGTRIDGIVAAWTSTTTDSGLSQYGNWAQSQIESASPARKRWLKPLLHSTYGLLAARPRPLQIGHNGRTNAGKHSTFLLGTRTFPVTERTMSNWQPVFVNVAQRGMIEAETQLRSLRMAQELTDAGCEITHIHTDGLHVVGELPLLPDTWDIKGLTDVTYIDNVSWIARERECLPGRDARERVEIIRHHANIFIPRTQVDSRDGQRGRPTGDLQRPQD
jgi:hypothetical protein